MSIEEKVIAIVSEQLGVAKEEIKQESKFVDDLKADSLDVPSRIFPKRRASNRVAVAVAARVRDEWVASRLPRSGTCHLSCERTRAAASPRAAQRAHG